MPISNPSDQRMRKTSVVSVRLHEGPVPDFGATYGVVEIVIDPNRRSVLLQDVRLWLTKSNTDAVIPLEAKSSVEVS